MSEVIDSKGCIKALLPDTEVIVNAKGLIDVATEVERLKGKLQKTDKEFNVFNNKLSNEGFLQKALPEVIEKDKASFEELKKVRSEIEAAINILKDL